MTTAISMAVIPRETNSVMRPEDSDEWFVCFSMIISLRLDVVASSLALFRCIQVESTLSPARCPSYEQVDAAM
jgi:hypothetical protein